MTLNQLEFENRRVIRALRSETDFQNVLAIVNNSSDEELAALCPVTSASALYYAVQRRNPDEALQLAKILVGERKACRADQVDRNRQTSLFFAGRDGNLKCVEYLIAEGCPVLHMDSASQTVLFYAARDGRVAVVEYLLDVQKMDVNAPDHLGQTALFYACRDGRTDTVVAMLKRGANPNIRDKQKKTARAYAMRSGHRELANMIKVSASEPSTTPHATRSSIGGAASGGDGRASAPSSAGGGGAVGKGSRHSVGRGDAAAALPTRKRYRLQYKVPPAGWLKRENQLMGGDSYENGCSDEEQQQQGTPLWMFAPPTKVRQFEHVCPHVAVWPRDAPVPPVKPACDPFKAQWWQQGYKIVEELINYEGGAIFAKPVDPRRWHCPDYFQIISKPMDFSTIKKQLRNGAYQTSKEFLEDVQLVFSNCYKYNRPESNISKIGTNLELYFRNYLIRVEFDKWAERESEIAEHLERVERSLESGGESQALPTTAAVSEVVTAHNVNGGGAAHATVGHDGLPQRGDDDGDGDGAGGVKRQSDGWDSNRMLVAEEAQGEDGDDDGDDDDEDLFGEDEEDA